jgi:predicted nucleic acid-binding protein
MYGSYGVVVWWATSVEIASAFARLERRKEIDRTIRNRGAERARLLSQSWLVVEPSFALRANAERFSESYDLRAGDALQLAASFAWCEGRSAGHLFFTADRKLYDASLAAGFDSRLFA